MGLLSLFPLLGLPLSYRTNVPAAPRTQPSERDGSHLPALSPITSERMPEGEGPKPRLQTNTSHSLTKPSRPTVNTPAACLSRCGRHNTGSWPSHLISLVSPSSSEKKQKHLPGGWHKTHETNTSPGTTPGTQPMRSINRHHQLRTWPWHLPALDNLLKIPS